MRRLIVALLGIAALGCAYAAWPVYSAYEIRRAVLAGDTATLSRKVEWDSLRASLKASITPETVARLSADPDAPRPSTWQRIKSAVAPSVADTVIERYVTPEHLPRLLGYGRIYRGTVRPALGLREPESRLKGTWLAGTPVDRFATFWARVRSATFQSPRRFVVEFEDKYRRERSYVGTLELKDWDWKLTNLAIAGGLLGAPGPEGADEANR
jgi:hypothetical protein